MRKIILNTVLLFLCKIVCDKLTNQKAPYLFTVRRSRDAGMCAVIGLFSDARSHRP